jgi:hypothetical protein
MKRQVKNDKIYTLYDKIYTLYDKIYTLYDKIYTLFTLKNLSRSTLHTILYYNIQGWRSASRRHPCLRPLVFSLETQK